MATFTRADVLAEVFHDPGSEFDPEDDEPLDEKII